MKYQAVKDSVVLVLELCQSSQINRPADEPTGALDSKSSKMLFGDDGRYE